jgi:hypothetical protein
MKDGSAMTDWQLFVELAKRFDASTSRGSSSPEVDSVYLEGTFITYDRTERRAYVTYPERTVAPKTSWLDNNILTWIDTLLGRDP